MDYPTLHGQDVTNFSSSSPHRMPTVSAAQALEALQSPPNACISTGMRGLDAALRRSRDAVAAATSHDEGAHEALLGGGAGGVARGQVTEIYGPPGVGKTALGIQLAANVLGRRQGVVWVDAAHPFPGPRLKEVLSSSPPSSEGEPPSTAELLENLTCFTAPTLPHIIALLCHTTSSFPPQDASLIIIDSFSTLFASAYPRTLDSTSTPRIQAAAPKYSPRQWAASRKWSVFQYVISSLQKLATLRNIAVVILNQTVTKMQSGSRATLIPAISSTAWDAGIATSIVLFRDWGWDEKEVRYAKVLKVDGVPTGSGERGEKVITFTIESHGLEEARRPETAETAHASIVALPSRKRKVVEILDSENEGSDEDYGWAEEDNEDLPQPPPQWQGSEDILIPGVEQRGEEEEEREEEKEDSELSVPQFHRRVMLSPDDYQGGGA